MVENTTLDRGLGIVRGDVFSIWRYVSGIPAARTVTNAWLTVKTDRTVADGSATFQKAITTSNSAGVGQIENTGTKGTAKLRFDLTNGNTLALVAGSLYYYDIQVKLDNSDTITVESGTISQVVEQTTIAT